MSNLKDKEYKLSEIYVHRKTQKVYMSENVKKAVLDFEKDVLLSYNDTSLSLSIIDKIKKHFGDWEK